MLAPQPRIWPAPPPAHVNGVAAASRYGYSTLAQILPSPQDKGDEQAMNVFPDEPVKLRKEMKQVNSADWRRKDRGRIKTEGGLITPCQVQEITTSSKHEQNGNTIPVGIAVARQRVHQSTPPPLTVLTCEERSTNQVTGWSGAPQHWPYGVESAIPMQGPPPLHLGRDPINGQLVLLPSGNLDAMQRAVLWQGGGTGGSNQPPPLVMPGPQPVLLSDNRYVTLAPPPVPPLSGHHNQDKRRTLDHSSAALHGNNNGGLTAVGLFPHPPPQAPFLMMPFSHQNNSLLLSTHLTEHNLNTMVVTNHQLSESAVLNPMEVITTPVDSFGGGGMIQQLPPSVVISHTETNSFVRSDINAVYPSQPQMHATQLQPPCLHQEHVVVKEEVEQIEENPEEETVEEELKTEVMDASNQTEGPIEGSDAEEEVVVKVEDRIPSADQTMVQEQCPQPDISGLELLLSSIAQYEKNYNSDETNTSKKCEDEISKEEWVDDTLQDGMNSGLGLLCTVAERCLEEEVVVKGNNESKCFLSPLGNNTDSEKENKDDKIKINRILEDKVISKKDLTPLTTSTPLSSEKRMGELLTTPERDVDECKQNIKRRPGRPKKKLKTSREEMSPNRREPPILQLEESISPLSSPPTLTPHKRKSSYDLSQESDEGSYSSCSHPPPLSPACSSPNSSKKRKVGRPKKRADETPPKTETIVTKSVPSNKDIERIIATKSCTMNHLPIPSTPPQSTSGSQHKIKPKLKAEAMVKQWNDDEELDLSPKEDNSLDDPLLSRSHLWKSPNKSKVVSLSPPRKPKVKVYTKETNDELPTKQSLPIDKADIDVKSSTSHVLKTIDKSLSTRLPETQTQLSSPSKGPVNSLSPAESLPQQLPPIKVVQSTKKISSQSPCFSQPSPKQKTSTAHHIPDCNLTEEHLKSLPCRILSVTNGQFYKGEITKIIAPDIYEVHIHKERSRKPQILCREEILSSSVSEVHCPEKMFIPASTRVCAYWSQQYSCFYPGRVINDSSSGPLLIDFDDGDNGTIDRTSVRFLPQDYPVVEPENLLGKRKKYSSINSSDSQKNSDVFETYPELKENTQNQQKFIEVNNSMMKQVNIKNRKEVEGNSQEDNEQNSIIDGNGADDIMSVLQSEKQEALEIGKKNKHCGKIHKYHRHHKHRREGCCKSHKCKHKHIRSRKHKQCRDEGNCINPTNVQHSVTASSGLNVSHQPNQEGGDNAVDKKMSSSSNFSKFLPESKFWSWVGSGTKKGNRGKCQKMYFDSIQREDDIISVGDCAVFISNTRRDRPYIGCIKSFWQKEVKNPNVKKKMNVKVEWFYHPEETIGAPENPPFPGALFSSPHHDENDVQTIAHRCEVLSLEKFQEEVKNDPNFLEKVYNNNNTFYCAGHYEPSEEKLELKPEVEVLCYAIKNDKGTNKHPKN